jgi:alkanesulfonate monooxygenase SsuD/methylene tetrahydromethanopterin reductase-like flavin-dependent oxidoreductase (luciferase family)
MRIGLHLPRLTYPGGPATLGPDLAAVAAAADQAGVDRISVMDHVWQIGPHGAPELDMLEAYTTLGFLAAHTSQAKLLTLVTGVTYRDPGLLAKMVTTLDVLSGGRAMLGIGAAWNEEESRGLGCSSRRPRSGSSGWRRRCRSACRCGRTTRAPTAARTTRSTARSARRSR